MGIRVTREVAVLTLMCKMFNMTNQFYRLFQATACGKHWTRDGMKHKDFSESEVKKECLLGLT